MFAHESLLKTTPTFCWLYLTLSLGIWGSIRYRLDGFELLSELDFNMLKVVHDKEVYRIMTGLLIPGFYLRHALLNIIGIHVVSWFVIAGYQARWERILMALFWNVTGLALYSWFIDPNNLHLPIVCLLVTMMLTTYAMQHIETSVPQLVTNMVALWMLVQILTQPY
jgi:hypothetical protein